MIEKYWMEAVPIRNEEQRDYVPEYGVIPPYVVQEYYLVKHTFSEE